MRSCHSLVAILIVCALGAFGLALSPTAPGPESSLQQELQARAERLTRAYLGNSSGCVVVSLRQAEGLRKEEREQMAPKGYVVSSQRKLENYKTYHLETVSEKLEIPRTITRQVQDHWVESVQVAVVVPPEAKTEPLVQLLESGLGLKPEQGDRVVVARSI